MYILAKSSLENKTVFLHSCKQRKQHSTIFLHLLKVFKQICSELKFSVYFQAGREIRQYFHSAEWSTALRNHEGGWKEGADRRVWTRRPDWSGKDHDGEGADRWWKVGEKL